MNKDFEKQKLIAYRKKIANEKKETNPFFKKEERSAKKKINKIFKYNFSKAANKLKNKSYKVFLKSEYWQKVRSIILKRDNYICECGEKKLLQVHHLTYKNHFSEHINLHDLITVCKKCHKKIHNIK